MDDGHGEQEYIRQVLAAYRKTPGTMGTVRRPDRVLAAQLYQRGVSVRVIENAFVLAAARRLMRMRFRSPARRRRVGRVARPALGPDGGQSPSYPAFCDTLPEPDEYTLARRGRR